MKEDFYVYAHLDAKEQIRYIGKGRRNRAWTFCQRSKRWEKVFESQFPKVKILEENLSEAVAYEREEHFIAQALLDGQPLVNVATGGFLSTWDDRAKAMLSEDRKGSNHWCYGIKRPIEVLAKLQAGKDRYLAKHGHPRLGAKLSPEHIAKWTENTHSPEAIAKRVAKMRGRKLSEEHKAKIGKASKETQRTKEWNESISAAKKGRPNGLLGRKMSEEHKAKISASRLASEAVALSGNKIWEKRRANGTASGFQTSKAKAVVCVDSGIVYRCASEAAALLGLSDKHIQACCAGRRNKHGGYSWKYV